MIRDFETWSVILVSPKGALNVGGIARLMGNFGFSDLRLVDPRCDLASVECKQMALHSYDIIKTAKIFPDFKSAIADRNQLLALSGRLVDKPRPHTTVSEVAQNVFPTLSPQDKVGLVFGREEIGLLLEELCLCQWQIEIPTSPDSPSLNLTSAAAIAFSHFFQASLLPRRQAEKKERQRPVKEKEMVFFDRFQKLIDDLKFTNKENPEMLRDDLWSIYHRAQVDDRDLSIFFGILTAVENVVRGRRL